MRVDKSWPVRVCSENNDCMRVDKSWSVRVCSENNDCMRVDKSWSVRVCSENNNCMRVDWILQHVARTLINFHQNLNQLNTDESWLDITKCSKNSHELYSKFEAAEHWWELTGYYQAQQNLSSTFIKIWTSSTLMRVDWILPSTTKSLMNSTQNLNQLNTDES
jgi:hypothetical protein